MTSATASAVSARPNAVFLLIEGEEIERYRRENLGRRGKYARIQPTDIPPVNPGAAKVIVPSDHVSTQRSARREPSTARRGEEVHRHQGGPKVVFRGINGGTYQWTQNAKPRRTSEREIGRWKELGFAVAWIEEATSEMLAAAGALNAKTNHRGASN